MLMPLRIHSLCPREIHCPSLVLMGGQSRKGAKGSQEETIMIDILLPLFTAFVIFVGLIRFTS